MTAGRATMSLRTAIIPGLLLGLFFAVAPSSAAAQTPAGYEAPVLQTSVTLDYPAALLAAPEDPPAGTIELRFVVGVDGVPREVEVTRGLHPLLDAAARDAVTGLRYQPGLVRGRPVEVVLALAIDVAAPARANQPVPQDSQTTEPNTEPNTAPTPTNEPPLAAPLRLSGRVLSAGQRTPIAGASVLVVPAGSGNAVGLIKKRSYNEPTPAWTMRAVTDGHARRSGAAYGDARRGRGDRHG